jgi:hypothetical protein
MNGSSYSVNFYRITEKGMIKCAHWYKKAWFYFKGDIRTVVFSIITTLLTTVAITLIRNWWHTVN